MKTFSKFYYGHIITEKNRTLDFKEENGVVLTAFLEPGSYTLSEYATKLSKALSETGSQDYLATINRSTRQITITASTTQFEILSFSGPSKGTSTLELAGFTLDADKALSLAHTSEGGSGFEYRPQFLLQSYTPFEHWQEAIGATKSKSAAGEVEIVSFGFGRKMECKFNYITNKDVGNNHAYESNPTGVQDFIEFLKVIAQGGRIEFMENRDDSDDYQKAILDNAPGFKSGTGFKIKELTNSITKADKVLEGPHAGWDESLQILTNENVLPD